MQISGPQHDAFEGVFTSFWLRTCDLVDFSATLGHTLRGHLAFLDVKPVTDAPFSAGAPTRDVPVGQSITSGVSSITSGSNRDWMLNLVGVIESNMLLGKDTAHRPNGGSNAQGVQKWVVVQTYGFHDAIATQNDDATGVDPVNDPYLFVNMIDDRSIVQGHDRTEIESMNFASGANTVLFPGKPRQSSGFVGYKIGSARKRFNDESTAAFHVLFSTISGFILCMGQSPRG